MIFRIILSILCIGGIFSISLLNRRYKNDKSAVDDIIRFFEQQQAFSVESGIKIKDLPREIARNDYLLMMVKDKTLKFEKGKYFLNR